MKKLICITCPKGCVLEIDHEGRKIIKVSGHDCPKGADYAAEEIENPKRTITSTVKAEGLALTMVPVKTDHAIPKARMRDAMDAIKKVRLTKSVKRGDAIITQFLGIEGLSLVATRSVEKGVESE